MMVVSAEPPVLKGEAHMSQTVIQGSSAILDCPIHGDPSPVLQWLRDGHALLRSHRIQALLNGSLVIYGINVNTRLKKNVIVIIFGVFLNSFSYPPSYPDLLSLKNK